MILVRICTSTYGGGEYSGPEVVRAHAQRFQVVKETRCGWWIVREGWGANSKRRWVSKTSRKKYAYPDMVEAVTSFRKRSKRRIELLEYELETARAVYELSKEYDPLSHYGKVVER